LGYLHIAYCIQIQRFRSRLPDRCPR
jgi:hypothetical protein